MYELYSHALPPTVSAEINTYQHLASLCVYHQRSVLQVCNTASIQCMLLHRLYSNTAGCPLLFQSMLLDGVHSCLRLTYLNDCHWYRIWLPSMLTCSRLLLPCWTRPVLIKACYFVLGRDHMAELIVRVVLHLQTAMLRLIPAPYLTVAMC